VALRRFGLRSDCKETGRVSDVCVVGRGRIVVPCRT
jgi:hypothetical protein